MIAPTSRKLGKYEIRHKLGRGGMADVYLAFDSELGHDVALKLIEDSPDPDTRDSIEAERRGAQLQGSLAAVDPHVARIFGTGDIDGFFYVAMEYVEGQDLAEVLRAGTQTPEEAADIAIAVLGTLEAAHTLEVNVDGKSFHGIVHGDIKPRNIRIDTRREVRVLDFGIAKALSLSRRLTRNEFGSVPYSSPERLEDGNVDVHSDLWSLAVMLYEMVTGLQPYQADTTERMERMIRSRVPPPPAPDPCPEPLRRILIKALMPDPEARYQSGREFADDLIMYRAGGPVRAATEDLDATRRTYRRADSVDLGATRRTSGGGENGGDTRRTSEYKQPDEVLNWPLKPPPQRNPLTRYVARGLAILLLAGCLYGLYDSVTGYLLYRRGQALEQAVQTEALTDPNEIWTQWTELSKDNPSSLMLRSPRKLVKQRLVEAADRVIASYRTSDAVYENGWKTAHENLARALTMEPDDSVRGKLRLTEGHLARITGTARHNLTELNDAVDKFNEAQRLLPNSPDPALGLARVYVYGLHDIDRAYQALQQAERRGYPIGGHEKAQLADGYRDRANRVFWDSRNVRGLPQEKDQIERARQDYERALELYQSAASYGNSSASIQDVQNSLESVNFRLNEIEHNKSSGNAAVGVLKKLLRIWR